jgi:hypothetical protein
MSTWTADELDAIASAEELLIQYRTKYANQPAAYVDPCLTPQAHAATLSLIPT